MNRNEVFKSLLAFLIFMAVIGSLLMIMASKAGATTPIDRWTLQGVAAYAERLASDAAGIGGGGSGAATATIAAYCATVTASLSAHVSTSIDAHGANERITGSLIIGSGTPDCQIVRSSTGTVLIASYSVLQPMLATPTSPAPFTHWADQNTGKEKVWDGSVWRSLW